MTDGKVLVILTLSVARYENRDIVVARFEALGLTAYGRTEAYAVFVLKRMFNAFIRKHREWGNVEDRLNRARVAWCWDKERPPGLQYEDTDDLVEDSWDNSTHTYSPPEYSWPVAA